MLVVAPTEHILRGFVIETTTEKDHVYLWRVVDPLHRPKSRVGLSYSNRISAGANGEKFRISANADDESAEFMAEHIVEHLPSLQKIRYPHDFLRHVSWRMGSREHLFRLDLALIQYRIGNVRQAIGLLKELDIEVDQLDEARQAYIRPIIKRALHEIETNPNGLMPLLDEWEEQNIRALDLQKSRPSPAVFGL
jgi:predicted Zn-dependent protease